VETTQDFAVYGLRVRSELPLRGWPTLDPAEPPDVVIARATLSEPALAGPAFTTRSAIEQGELRLGISGIGRFRAAGGTRIEVDPDPAAKPHDIQRYLTGVVLGTVLQQRGTAPLHASCVALGGQAIAFAGPSGAGKSTVLAALLHRGAGFVSDDICVLAALPDGRFGVRPSAMLTKLDVDALAALERPELAREPAGGTRGKFLVPVGPLQAAARPLPLRRVYLLRDGEGAPRTQRLSGLDAVTALLGETYYLEFAAALGLTALCFRQAAALAHQVQVLRLHRGQGPGSLRAMLDLIEHEARQA
jgi:hypothetical protein